MKVKNFEDLEIWQKAVKTAKEIYLIINKGDFNKDWGLKDQVRRSAVSISANIAEGFERSGNNEFIRFLKIAKGSCGELRSHLVIAREISYITQDVFENFNNDLQTLSLQIGRFISYLTKHKSQQQTRKK